MKYQITVKNNESDVEYVYFYSNPNEPKAGGRLTKNLQTLEALSNTRVQVEHEFTQNQEFRGYKVLRVEEVAEE